MRAIHLLTTTMLVGASALAPLPAQAATPVSEVDFVTVARGTGRSLGNAGVFERAWRSFTLSRQADGDHLAIRYTKRYDSKPYETRLFEFSPDGDCMTVGDAGVALDVWPSYRCLGVDGMDVLLFR